jgi:hypothetical protein
MKWTLPTINWPTWTRQSNGDNFYDLTEAGDWTANKSNLWLAQNHPILTPALLFVSKLFSQAEFSIKGNKSNADIVKLLDNPNDYQTRQDFLETLMFMMLAQGVAVVAKSYILGFKDPRAMFVLNCDLIKWPEEFEKEKFRKDSTDVSNKSIIYDQDNENLRIKIKDLMFFYDSPNMFYQNPFRVSSRLDGLRQTLINTCDSLVAKNIILKSNGKELITGKKEGFPLTPEEKRDVENLFNNKIGLAFDRKRGVVTKSDISWQSLHIALRDLGLDESIKVDGNLIYTALHIPKDILSLEAKKTTYNNFKESMVSYIQNEMQPSINSFTAVINKTENVKLIGSYDHLPIMQFILLEKYEVVNKQAVALRALLMVGVPENVALEMCGFDPSLQLEEMQQENNSDGQQQQNSKNKINGDGKENHEVGCGKEKIPNG